MIYYSLCKSFMCYYHPKIQQQLGLNGKLINRNTHPLMLKHFRFVELE